MHTFTRRDTWWRVAGCATRNPQLATLLRRCSWYRRLFDDTSLLLLADHDGDRVVAAHRCAAERKLPNDDAVGDAGVGLELHGRNRQAVPLQRGTNRVERLIDVLDRLANRKGAEDERVELERLGAEISDYLRRIGKTMVSFERVRSLDASFTEAKSGTT